MPESPRPTANPVASSTLLSRALPREQVYLLGLLLVSIYVSFFLNIHAVPLFDVDEGAFGEATREMIARGDYVSTFLFGEPRYDKPILIYWLQAASVNLLGLSELALRLPSAIAAAFWVLAVLLFTRRVTDTRTGIIAAIVTATTLQISVIGSAATADALLNLFIVVSMFSVYLYYLERDTRYIYLAFAAVGLGFLTKGPVAVLVPLAVSGLFCVIKGEWRLWLRVAFHPGGLALFLLIAMPWYIAQYLREGQAFLDGFFLTHNLSRFQGPMHGHSGSLFYYVPVVLLGVLPYTAVLLRVLGTVRSWIRDDLQLYLLIWFGFVFIFFSFSGTKLPHYVIYGLTGMCILMALHFRELRSPLWTLLPAGLFFALLLFLPEIVGAVLPSVRDPFVQARLAGYADHFGLGYRLYFALALGAVIYLMIERRLPVTHKLVSVGLLSVLGLSALVVPTVGAIQQGPIKEAALLVKERGEPAVLWQLSMPSFSVYTERVTEVRPPEPGELALTRVTRLKELEDYELLYLRNGVALIRRLQ
jgi:4-amino-4-deoxy-L-arabinose transferase-like glycosyltransferase